MLWNVEIALRGERPLDLGEEDRLEWRECLE